MSRKKILVVGETMRSNTALRMKQRLENYKVPADKEDGTAVVALLQTLNIGQQIKIIRSVLVDSVKEEHESAGLFQGFRQKGRLCTVVLIAQGGHMCHVPVDGKSKIIR